MKLEHAFDVPASPQATLALLLDAERVVPCMPGARLTEVVDDGTWRTTMAVKLGPVALDFLNEVRVLEMDEAAGRVGLGVKGRDTRGKGGADGIIEAVLLPRGSGTTVSLTTHLRFSGQAAQLGRPSVVQDVSARLVDQFAACIAARLDNRTRPGQRGAASEPAGKPISGLSLMLAALRSVLGGLFARRTVTQRGAWHETDRDDRQRSTP